MITLVISDTYLEEKKYTLDVIFRQILKLEYTIKLDENISEYQIFLPNKKKLYIADFFFSDKEDYLRKNKLPKNVSYLNHSLLTNDNLIILYGDNEVIETCSSIKINSDLIAGSFFMLSRWEELIIKQRDEHDRFPAKASTAFKYKFLNRPIVDEYANFILKCITKLCPSIVPVKVEGKVVPTCDVDYPFDPTLLNHRTVSKALLGDLLKRKSIDSFYKRINRYKNHRKGDYSNDSYYSFNWYMDICEKFNKTIEFYFISGHSGGAIDGCYNISDSLVTDLMKHIKQRGHKIAMHGSYNTFRNKEQLSKEKKNLEKVVQYLGLGESINMNRQHFLRWDVFHTPDCLEKVGFKYDSTGAYADVSGFRYGTAHSFQMWSWQKRKALNLIQKPLILMEVSVIGEGYQNLGYSNEAMDYMFELKKQSLKFGGDFNFLWHNSYFNNVKDKEFFTNLISNRRF